MFYHDGKELNSFTLGLWGKGILKLLLLFAIVFSMLDKIQLILTIICLKKVKP